MVKLNRRRGGTKQTIKETLEVAEQKAACKFDKQFQKKALRNFSVSLF